MKPEVQSKYPRVLVKTMQRIPNNTRHGFVGEGDALWATKSLGLKMAEKVNQIAFFNKGFNKGQNPCWKLVFEGFV